MPTHAAGIVFSVLDEMSAVPYLDGASDVYADVYADAPYRESESDFREFRDAWARRLVAPDFRLVVCERRGECLGFTFGHGLAPDTKWWSGIVEHAGDPGIVRETPGRTFAVIELAVRAAHRGLGLGRHLQSRLLAGIAYERATLLVRPDAELALNFYRAAGYRRVAALRPFGSAPIYDAMVLEPPIPAVSHRDDVPGFS